MWLWGEVSENRPLPPLLLALSLPRSPSVRVEEGEEEPLSYL